MRNLKRALSLALASVMLLGMMVVGTGASYADVSSKHNEEAIEVLQAIGVMYGDDKGNFNPDQKVTRGEMAVVMSNLLGYDANDFAGTKLPFTDVPAWANGYVAACYADGITAGISATEFGFNYEVTTAQAALMMMKALGYFQYASDFGGDWQVATVKQGTKIDLFDSITAGASTAMTRNEVAQIALNSLEATMVEAKKSGSSVSIGDIVITSDVEYVPYTVSSGTWADSISVATATVNGVVGKAVQLGEQLYKGKLELASATPVAESMGRPARTWEYKDETIGTYANKADKTFVISKTDGTKASLTAWLQSINENYYITSTGDLTGDSAITSSILTVNNVPTAGNTYTTTAGTTWGVGDVVEVYQDAADSNKISKIIVTQNSLYEITKVDTDVNSADAKNDVKAYISLKTLGGTTYTIKDTDIVGYNAATYVKGAYVAAVLNAGNTAALSSYVVNAPVEGKVTGYTASKWTVNGTAYEKSTKSDTSAYVANDFDGTYALYLDANGYLLGIKVVKASQIVTDAVMPVALWAKTGNNEYNTVSSTYYAQIVDMDGVLSNVVIGKTTASGKIYGVSNDGYSYTEATLANNPASSVTYYYVATDGTIKSATQTNSQTVATFLATITDSLINDGNSPTTAATSATPFYTRSASTVVVARSFYTTSDNADGYVEMTAYTDNGSIKIGTVGSYTSKKSDDNKITGVSIDSTTAGVYFTNDTKFVIVEGTKDSAKTTVKTGMTAAFNVTSANVSIIAQKVGTNYEAAYVMVSTADYTGSDDSTVFYVKSNSATTVDGGKQITVYNMDGTTQTLLVASGASVSANTFYKVSSVSTDGVYTLAAADALTFDTDDWSVDKETGSAVGMSFVSLYNNVFTMTDGTYTVSDVPVDGLVIVDNHEKDQDEFVATGAGNFDGTANNTQNTYAGSVTTLEAMNSATDAGYTVTFNVKIGDNGAQFIVITEVSR